VVRQLAAKQADRDRSLRQIVHRPRDARHGLRIGHREAALLCDDKLATTEDTEDTEQKTNRQGTAPPCPPRPQWWRARKRHSFAPQPLQNFASLSLAVSHAAHWR